MLSLEMVFWTSRFSEKLIEISERFKNFCIKFIEIEINFGKINYWKIKNLLLSESNDTIGLKLFDWLKFF